MNECDKAGQDAKSKGKRKVREASSGSEASETLCDSQSPASVSTPPIVSPSSEPVHDRSDADYQYLPVRSEELGRQPYQYNYNPGVHDYPAANYSQYPTEAPGWNLTPTNAAAPQSLTAQLNSPLNEDPAASDGFLRTLAVMASNQAGDFMQAAQSMSAPSNFTSGENVLGMWSNMSGNMQ